MTTEMSTNTLTLLLAASGLVVWFSGCIAGLVVWVRTRKALDETRGMLTHWMARSFALEQELMEYRAGEGDVDDDEELPGDEWKTSGG